MSSFVSYSRLDRDLVIPLVAILRLGDPTAFRDEDSVRPGSQWQEAIDHALVDSSQLVVMWTLAASESKYVEAECAAAIRMRKDIVPLLLDDTPLPEVLAAYQWVDFRPFIRSAIERRLSMSAEALAATTLGLLPGSTYVLSSKVVAGLYMRLLQRKIDLQFSDAECFALLEAVESRIVRSPARR